MFKKRKIIKEIDTLTKFEVNDETVIVIRPNIRVSDNYIMRNKNDIERYTGCKCLILSKEIDIVTIIDNKKYKNGETE